jgi:hypothetical protein
VAFNPRALISGSAFVGLQKHRVLGDNAPNFEGTVMGADLTYTLLGRTRFTVTARRQLEYSFVEELQYLTGGADVVVAQRLGNSWDVGASIGRDRLAYRNSFTARNTGAPINFADETVLRSSGEVAYNLGHTQIGLRVEYRERLSDARTMYRGYERLRIGSTFTYTF